MSDFKFNCIHCGQTLAPDPSLSCQRITCPACKRSLVVPWIPAPHPHPAARESEQVAIPQVSIPALSPPKPESEVKIATERLQIAGRRKQKEGHSNAHALAVVAFILALIIPFGAAPAIISGHLAKHWMRRSGDRSGETLATAALVIAYTCALFTIVFLIRTRLQPGA